MLADTERLLTKCQQPAGMNRASPGPYARAARATAQLVDVAWRGTGAVVRTRTVSMQRAC